MSKKRKKKIIFVGGLSIFGWLYFQAFSSLEINFILKDYLTILPLAIIAVTIYLIEQKKP